MVSGTLLGLAIARAEEAGDWRLELFEERQLSSETPALENLRKGLDVSAESLDQLIQGLAADKFAEREQAQKEVLLKGTFQHLQREITEGDDPEVRKRLRKILLKLEAGGRWSKEELLARAVASMLHERDNPGVADPTGELFVELFGKAKPSLADGYGKLRFVENARRNGFAADGVLHMEGKLGEIGDQRLLFEAMNLIGKPEFPDKFRVDAKLGGGAAAAGTYHVGISIGNVCVLFHPALKSGAFRFQRVDNQLQLTENANLGFDPPAEKMLSMGIDVIRLANGAVKLDVLVANGTDSFRASKTLRADVIGKLDSVGLNRSGAAGGDGIFDDLVLDLGKQ